MSVLFLWLNSIPCADEALEECESIVSTTDEAGDMHDDGCSPFCNCSCCSCFSIPVHHNIESVVKVSMTAFSAAPQRDILEFSVPIWQPPKLG